MILLDLVFTGVLALTFAWIIVSIASWRRDTVWPGFWFYFTLLFLGIWAVRLWLDPATTPAYGWHLFALLVAGLLITLAALATIVPRRAGYGGTRPRPVADPDVPREDWIGDAEAARAEPEVAQYSYGLLYWVLIIALVGAILAGLVAPSARTLP